ncbi:MAG: DNA mismatch repair endonuclease MutH [Shewanella sp.]|uniref:DNA mismatch repair endonuclease MutH n=1 Tax=Shewanella sp. SNU WT4 TaxID=2590015 RepID=UPI00112BFF77|nr:DNA mismatch repair endonuclease MutH [Shewanella sp. SNU WT4]QDF66298.1 DNA mismatch repair endonuclease MutH [Shewanella sp. SNU WT4]
MNNTKHSPQTLAELLERADNMAGMTLAQLAQANNIVMPANLQRHKGWVGQLIELELGATAGSKPEQDFRHLGVELKTIPINAAGKPLETTYVCVAPLNDIQGLRWQDCLVSHKLQQVLWVPIAGDRHIPLGERRIGTAFLWQPSPSQWQQLQQDWEEIMELIATGQVNKITARHGEVLQLRPKAANSRVKTISIDSLGQKQLSNPRGFYLKINFTAEILSQAFQ